METGKTSKPASRTGRYFKYAIGEIVLVVIGILIALQVNNWNEYRKQRQIEVKVLKEMETALSDDIGLITTNLRSYNEVKRALQIIKEQLPVKEPTNDSLPYAFRMSLFNNSVEPDISAYETLKSKGLDLISNDSLRRSIVTVYEIGYKYYQDTGKDMHLSETFIQEYCATLFNNLSNFPKENPTMVPNNYKALQKDTLYMTIINTRLSQVGWALLTLELDLENVEELKENIQSQLIKLK
jgi:hypothetical protein